MRLDRSKTKQASKARQERQLAGRRPSRAEGSRKHEGSMLPTLMYNYTPRARLGFISLG